MKVLALVLAMCLLPTIAKADLPPPVYTPITTTSSTVIKNGPGLFYGIDPLAIQTTVISCWDNTTNSGQLLYNSTPAPSGGMALQAVGNAIRFFTGLTCQISTSIVAPGFLVLWN